MAIYKLYGLDQQGRGAFDGGRIVESKPIGFPGEGSEVKRVGPLFYWALATANQDNAIIGLHPHRAFEIMSFVIDGELGHYDTGGHEELLYYGDVQIMQTGSGISHEERFNKEGTSIFQIWFEPNLDETIRQPAVYHYGRMNGEAEQSDFQRQLIGPESVSLAADAKVEHVRISAGSQMVYKLESGRSLAIVPFKGKLHTADKTVEEASFLVVQSEESDELIHFDSQNGTEFILVDVPEKVDYPLMRK